ncbi:hypothetical protein BC833DRAFT_581250 [Globomyces pollinis-pini]|nr:hypothetical protein BC833DRAFT_581250 [Globomyces pollinis-pini]
MERQQCPFFQYFSNSDTFETPIPFNNGIELQRIAYLRIKQNSLLENLSTSDYYRSTIAKSSMCIVYYYVQENHLHFTTLINFHIFSMVFKNVKFGLVNVKLDTVSQFVKDLNILYFPKINCFIHGELQQKNNITDFWALYQTLCELYPDVSSRLRTTNISPQERTDAKPVLLKANTGLSPLRKPSGRQRATSVGAKAPLPSIQYETDFGASSVSNQIGHASTSQIFLHTADGDFVDLHNNNPDEALQNRNTLKRPKSVTSNTSIAPSSSKSLRNSVESIKSRSSIFGIKVNSGDINSTQITVGEFIPIETLTISSNASGAVTTDTSSNKVSEKIPRVFSNAKESKTNESLLPVSRPRSNSATKQLPPIQQDVKK